ncbi:MAG: glycosyltransferase family 2 protein [Muribaculaceae bacterium]
MVKISLITATKNQASTIEDTIKSVFNQSYPDIEYIIVDGNSTDNTRAIVEPWIERFGGRLKYVVDSDNGVFEAINKGITMSSGDVVGLLHADDRFTCNTVLECVASAMSDPSLDLVYGDIHYTDRFNTRSVKRYYSSEHFRRAYLRLGFAPPHPSMYCRRQVFSDFGLYREDYRVASDFEMFVRLLWIPRVKAGYIPLDIVAMRTGGLSTRWYNSLWLNTIEKYRALRANGIHTAILLLPLRYLLNLRHYYRKSIPLKNEKYILKYEPVE